MDTQIKTLTKIIAELEGTLEAEFAKQRAQLRFTLEQGKVAFEKEILRRHRELRIGLGHYVFNGRPLVFVTAPFIYAVIIPLILLDALASLYQAVCFPVYGIEKVRRSEYLIFDRHHLAYLNALQKLNCAYCSYATGLIGYVREIAARTEQHWCPIKHASRILEPHRNYADFVTYGDAEGFRQTYDQTRAGKSD